MKLTASALAVLLLPALFGCSTTAGYLWEQGVGLLRDNRGARRVDALLAGPDTPAETRRFLLDTQDIRRFGTGLGLKPSGNYTRYKELDRDHLVDVVQACAELSFEAYTWRYPLLGRLPYKGFYDRAQAEEEAARLRAQGLDVIVREVDAFSTLGFFRDRLFSFMKAYSLDDLASLMLHEQTHATVFLRGQTGFNEQLASFVAERGALMYLRARFGEDSEDYRGALAARADEELALSFIRDMRRALEALYSGPLNAEAKRAEKQRIIDEHKRRFVAEWLPLFHDPGYARVAELPINNAYLSLYDLYTGDLPLLERYFTEVCGSDLATFLRQVKSLAKDRGGAVERMRRELSGADSGAP
jgi:predicted aminopeptidase